MSPSKGTPLAQILIVDDNPANLVAFETTMKCPDVEIIKALSGEEALSCLLKYDIAVILLDILMPGMDGFETAELIRGNADTKEIPIIFITAAGESRQTVFKGYESGAVDLLFKPVDAIVLKSKINVFINLYHQRKTIEAQKEKIISQHRALVEEERLKVVLQMAGATAHELNQPLMVLLGNLELLEMDNFDPESVKHLAPRIKKSAQRLSDTVKKIQTIESYKPRRHDICTDIIYLNNETRLLHVAADADTHKIVKGMLTNDTNMTVFQARTIASALQNLKDQPFDMILLDFYLPDGTGPELIKMIHHRHIALPVICITGLGSEEIATEVLRGGADDYLTKKNLTKDKLIKAIKKSLEKFRLKADLNRAMEKMAAMSTYDALTGLYNRRYMNEVLDQEFSRATRYGLDLSCILFDIDFFKQVNDHFGHACGDFVLKEFSSRICRNKRESDYVFRYGGEEFLLLLPQTSAEGARRSGENILRCCRNHNYEYDDHSFKVTVSLGVADLSSCRPESANELVASADKALYQAKAAGRNCLRLFERAKDDRTLFKKAYDEKGFLHLKKQISSILENTKEATITSLELLTREIGCVDLTQETRRIKTYIDLFCKHLGLTDCVAKAIKQAASLNNCFKIMLGDEIFFKKEALTDEDKKKIEKLPYLQLELINKFDAFDEEKKMLLYHHEWYNGSGYPEGLRFDEIPLGAKIFSITNALVAMTADRAFREKMSYEQAVEEIVNHAGTQFDPVLVDSFLDMMIETNQMTIPKKVQKR